MTSGNDAGYPSIFNPFFSPNEHQMYDLDFRDSCCTATDLCHLFYMRRPPDNCVFYFPPFLGKCNCFIIDYYTYYICAILFIEALGSVVTVSSGQIISCQDVLRTTYSSRGLWQGTSIQYISFTIVLCLFHYLKYHLLAGVTSLPLIALCTIVCIEALSSVVTVSSGKTISCQNVLRTTHSRL